MKVRGGILNYVLVVVLIISVISTLIFLFLRYQQQVYFLNHSKNNSIHQVQTGLHYLLSLNTPSDNWEEIIQPFEQQDSILVGNTYWGAYNLHYAVAGDALYQADAYQLVAQKGAFFANRGLYLNDTEIPISLSGSTKLSGQVHIPAQGIKTAYYKRRGYQNDSLVYGQQLLTDKDMSTFIDQERLEGIYQTLGAYQQSSIDLDSITSLVHSFKLGAAIYHRGGPIRLSQDLSGRVIICSNQAIEVTAQAQLNDVILFAPQIKIKAGFHGSLQAFATDTLVIESDVALQYPSVLCLADLKPPHTSYLSVGTSQIAGELIHFSPHFDLDDQIQLHNNLSAAAEILGMVYLQGYSLFGAAVQGNTFIDRFVLVDSLRNSTYINFLIDAEISAMEDNGLFKGSYLFKEEDLTNSILKRVD